MKKLIAMVILLSSMAIAQVSNPGASFPDPGSAGLCWVSTGATTYAWGACSGSAATAFSAITGSTNTGAAMVIGTGASLATSGTGTIAATTSAKWAVARTLAGNSVDGSANVAFPNKFIVQGTADAGLTGAQFMGALATGLVKNTTTTGVQSIAAAGTDYVAPATTVNGKALSSNITLGLASSDFANQGTTTTVLHGNAAGNPSFAQVSLSADVTGNLPVTNLNSGTSASASTFWRGDGTWATPAGSGTLNAATQYAFPYYSAAGSATTLSGVPSPTANGFYTVGYNVTGGVALAPTAVLSGVPTNAQVGTTYTVLYSDRNSYLSFSNAGAIAVTLPQAGSTGFTSNFAFDACAIGAGTVTITPTTSNISYSSGTAYSSAQTSMALTTGQCAFIYSDNTNYFAFQIKGGGSGVTSIATTSPITGGTITTTGTIACATCVTSAAALTSGQLVAGAGLQATAVTNLTGDVTTSGGVATTVAKVNGVAYAASPSTDTAPVITAANTATYKALPACTDTGGNHLNYDTTTHAFSCGTSGSGGGVASISGGTGPISNSASTGAVTLTYSGTSGGIPYFSSATALSSSAALTANVLTKGGGAGAAPTNSSITDNGTTVATAEPVVLGTANCTVFGTAGGQCATEGTAATNVAGASVLYPDSTAHEWKAAMNGSSTAGIMNRTAGAISLTAQTATIATTTACAASAGACNVAGQYLLNYNFWGTGTACSSVTAGKVVLTFTWTDENGTTHSAIPAPIQFDQKTAAANVTGTFSFNTALATEGALGSMPISTNGTVIQYTATYTACTTGTGAFGLRISTVRAQ